MPFNGSGVYTPPAADFPVVTNTVISSTHFNNTINDIATGLTTCLTKDGQTTPTANIKLGGFKLTGLGVATTSGDALSYAQAATVTTLTASTSLTTPTLTASTSVITPIVDSGTTGALSLKTNNGTTGFQIVDTASGVNFWQAQSGATTLAARLLTGGETNVTGQISSKGTGSLQFFTDAFANQQFEILRVSAANRWVTVAGSNAGNPTISTTAGNLAITPSVSLAAALTMVGNLTIGSTPPTIGAIRLDSHAQIVSRNAGNSGNLVLISTIVLNAIDDLVSIGNNTNGVMLVARSGAGAPAVGDLSAGTWMLWRDTAGATTKIYYNNAGVLQSVALA